MTAPQFLVPEVYSSITEDATTIYPNIAAAANASGVYSYLIYHKYTPYRYSIRRLDSDLATIGSDSDLSTTFGDYAKFASLADGSFLFVKLGSAYGANNIVATKVLPDGTVQSTFTIIPNPVTSYICYYGDVVGTPDGGFVVLYSTTTVQNPAAAPTGDMRLKLVYVSPTNVVGTPIEIDSGFRSWAATGESNNKHMAILSNGNLLVSWVRYLNPTVNQTTSIHYRIFNLTDLSPVSGILNVGTGAYTQTMAGTFPASNGFSILYIDTDVSFNGVAKFQTFFNDGSIRSIPVPITDFYTGFVFTDYSRYIYGFSTFRKAAPNGNPDGELTTRGDEIRSFTSLRDGKISVHSVTVDPGNSNNFIRYTELFDPGSSQSPPPNVYSIRIF